MTLNRIRMHYSMVGCYDVQTKTKKHPKIENIFGKKNKKQKNKIIWQH